jgi:hypothetical protein
MSSCRLFKALGLVNTCDDESPPVPEPEPIDANIRIKNAKNVFDNAIKQFSKAHEQHDGAVLEEKKSRQSGSRNDTRKKAAERIIKYGKEATDGATKLAIENSIMIPYESTSSPLVSPNGKYFAYVNSNGKFEISTTEPTKTYGTIGVSKDFDYWYIKHKNKQSKQGTSFGGIQLQNDGTILTNLSTVDDRF